MRIHKAISRGGRARGNGALGRQKSIREHPKNKAWPFCPRSRHSGDGVPLGEAEQIEAGQSLDSATEESAIAFFGPRQTAVKGPAGQRTKRAAGCSPARRGGSRSSAGAALAQLTRWGPHWHWWPSNIQLHESVWIRLGLRVGGQVGWPIAARPGRPHNPDLAPRVTFWACLHHPG
ncbi:hypothetical protein ANO11243_057620 [Dothideomycetidae sp. 11243]|nr:hypothetical protein ANO11243_057620 [fungal sp. No.11243]